MAPLPEPRFAGLPVLRRLPGGIRRGLCWLPHAALAAAAVVMFLAGATAVDFQKDSPLVALTICTLLAVPFAVLPFRPALAYWISLADMVLGIRFGSANAMMWSDYATTAHFAVMVLVVLRTRPRVAPQVWLITFAASAAVLSFQNVAGQDAAVLTAISALLLAVAASARAWYDDRKQLVRTETETARERGRRTVLEERAVIARELHDVVAHHMSVIAIQAEAAPYRVETIAPELAASFGTIRENAVAALAELRRVLGLVRSDDPDVFAGRAPEAPQPTLAGLGALLDGVRSAGLEVESSVTGTVRTLPQGVELSAYRLIQEALSNALRHSPGAAARAELAYAADGLRLRIVNGRPGRLAKQSPGAGHGLLGMRERVQLLGGEMTAGETEDGGFEVSAFLPAPEESAAGGEEGASSREETAAAPEEGAE